MLTQEQAEKLLKQYHLHILKDSAFGDMEFGWYGEMNPETERRECIADGYMGGNDCYLTFLQENDTFTDRIAIHNLLGFYKTIKIESNNI